MPTDLDKYILDTDASDTAIGAVLSQIQGGEERLIAYASRTYSRAEKNYCTTRKELLAVVYFTKHFKQYLLGSHFLIRTDHAVLAWLQRASELMGQQGGGWNDCRNSLLPFNIGPEFDAVMRMLSLADPAVAPSVCS